MRPHTHRRFGFALAAAALHAGLAPIPAYSAESFACREIERRFEGIKPEITSVQLNATLFQAADKGCEPLVRALLAAGAAVEARDRLGAIPLAYAARSGHLALVDLLLEKGRPIDSRHLPGSTARLAAAHSDPPP